VHAGQSSHPAPPGYPDAIPVPAHGNQSIKRGTLGNILRTAGISRQDFDRLL
jgi:predicted RNA binding protein YcfA (HicA-like mRNA interferase family)